MTKLIVGDHHIHGQKKIAFSYSDQGGTWRKLNNLKPLFSRNEGQIIKSCRPETTTSENQYDCNDLSA